MVCIDFKSYRKNNPLQKLFLVHWSQILHSCNQRFKQAEEQQPEIKRNVQPFVSEPNFPLFPYSEMMPLRVVIYSSWRVGYHGSLFPSDLPLPLLVIQSPPLLLEQLCHCTSESRQRRAAGWNVMSWSCGAYGEQYVQYINTFFK